MYIYTHILTHTDSNTKNTQGNPLKIPPPEVIKKGTRHFLDYLRRIVDLQKNNVCDLSDMGIVEPELPQYILRQAFVR